MFSYSSHNRQRSVWSISATAISQHRQPWSEIDGRNAQGKTRRDFQCKSLTSCSSMPPLVQGLLMGTITSILLLGIALALWLAKLTTPSTTVITTTTNGITTTITYVPLGIYALNISTCATWNQTGITVAGNQNGTAGSDLQSLFTPVSIFVDNNNTLYIADRDNNRAMKYYSSSTTGILVAGNGTVGNDSKELNQLKGIAIDQSGAIIIADSNNYRIQKFVGGSMVGLTLFSNSSSSPLGQTRDLHIDVNNNIYVADSDYNQVVKFTPYSSTYTVLAGGGAAGYANNQLNFPYGSFIDANNSLYVVDNGNQRIMKYLYGSSSGILVAGITSSSGSATNQLYGPRAVIVDNNGYMYIADNGNNRIMKWTTNYTDGGVCVVGCTGTWGTAASQLRNPRDTKFDQYGNLYVSDQGNNRVQKFTIQNSCTTTG